MIFKTLAAITLVMAFVQAPARTGDQTQDSAPVHAQSPSAARAVPRPPAPAQTTGTSASAPTSNPSDANSCPGGNCDDLWPSTVKVANPPPAVPIWPLHDRLLRVALLVLVVLGYCGILLAVSTLKKIERNTRSGEEAAAAAHDGARGGLVAAEAM